MAIQAPEKLYTAEDLERMGDRGRRYELVQGSLVEMSPVNLDHGYIVFEIIGLLRDYLKKHQIGRATTETGYRLESEPDTVRGPDVSLILNDRLPQSGKGFPKIAPHLAVEVLSPGNTVSEMNSKIAEYFAAGVVQVWIVDADRRTIQVYTSPKKNEILDVTDTLDGGTLLPGFSVPVREIFAVLPDSDKA